MNEKEIMNELYKITNNEKLLKKESYLKFANKNNNNIKIDKIKLKAELKQINENKNGCITRLNEINSRIKALEYKYELNQGILDNERQEKLHKFFDNQKILNNNKNNNELNLKIKNLKNENKKLLTNMYNDTENQLMKKINEFKLNKEKETQNKIILLKKMREDERKEILKRKNKASEETKKLNEFMNKKPEIKKYLYQKINNSFNDKENIRLLKEKNKRKFQMKPIEYNINNMMRNYKKYKNKINLELEEKTHKLKHSWSERIRLIPSHKTQLRNILDIEEQNIKLEKEHEIEKRKELKQNQINYSKNIESKQIFYMKQFNEKQKNESAYNDFYLRQKINLNRPFILNNINNYSDLIREKLFLSNINNSQDNISQTPDNNEDTNKNNNITSQILDIPEKTNKTNFTKLPNLNQNKQNKILNLKQFAIKKNLPLNKNSRIINNLKVRKNKEDLNKAKTSKTIEIEDINYKGTKEINELIEKNGLDKNIFEIANCKLESLNEKKKQKSLLLKYEGGLIKNPGLGEEICDILIDSMTAKLSLINEIRKIRKNNKNHPELIDKSIGPGNSLNDDNINNNKENGNVNFNK